MFLAKKITENIFKKYLKKKKENPLQQNEAEIKIRIS